MNLHGFAMATKELPANLGCPDPRFGRLGWTALHLAASYGHVEVAQYLAERWPQLVQTRQCWEIWDLDTFWPGL